MRHLPDGWAKTLRKEAWQALLFHSLESLDSREYTVPTNEKNWKAKSMAKVEFICDTPQFQPRVLVESSVCHKDFVQQATTGFTESYSRNAGCSQLYCHDPADKVHRG